MPSTLSLLLEATPESAVVFTIAAEGRVPFPPGSVMLVRADGSFSGNISGGCVETEVVARALKVIESGAAVSFTLPLDSPAFAGADSCASSLSIRIIPAADLMPATAALSALATARTPAILNVRADGICDVAAGTLPKGRAELLEDGMARIPVPLPLRLVIIGAVEIAYTLYDLASRCGHEAVIVEPREAFARGGGERAVVMDWPDDYLKSHPADAATAVITLAHDMKLDDAALALALASPAFYIAALGSRATHAKRRARLEALGINGLERIQGPAGLAIGALTSDEIAISILAALIAAHRTGNAREQVRG